MFNSFSRLIDRVYVTADLDIAYGKFCLARLGWGAKEFRARIQREEEEGEEEDRGADEQRPEEEVGVATAEEQAFSEDVLETMFEECGCAPVQKLEPVRTFGDARVLFKSANPR